MRAILLALFLVGCSNWQLDEISTNAVYDEFKDSDRYRGNTRGVGVEFVWRRKATWTREEE